MNIATYLDYWSNNLEKIIFPTTYGKILRISGFFIEGVGLKISIGGICRIKADKVIKMEVIGFSNEVTYFIAFEEPTGILPGTLFELIEDCLKIPVGLQIRGRVLNGFGIPIDNKGPLMTCDYYPIAAKTDNPLERKRINTVIDVGIRAINSLLTVGMGQRIGIFAGSGVGKSVLLGMITRFTEADIVVVGLIGERGREIKEFLEESIGKDALHKTIIVAAPINTSPLERTNGILSAVTLAEYFRDLGKNVLLIIDSLTRYAHALRNMYVLFGEPVSSKGYPPSVFSKLSQLSERCGNGNTIVGGSITAFFTVLIDADNMNDPIADHVRSILDGHIVLSRELAEAAHFPAIDICKSISRVMPHITTKEHLQKAMRFKKIYSYYLQNEDLIKIGMYKAGSDLLLDEGVKLFHRFNEFLKQNDNESVNFENGMLALYEILDDSNYEF